MATDVTTFGRATDSGEYMTCEVAGKWHFCPTDSDWLTFNGNDEFSRPYDTEAEALTAAVLWEGSDGMASV